MPWDLPLEHWQADRAVLRDLPVGPSRHLVRFVVIDETTYALKEESVENARHEYEVLVHLEALALPSVRAIGIAERPLDDTAILVTEFLRHSLQYRRLLMRVPLTADSYRDRLLDAMASLLVDLHRAGVYWGDCSLANTLFRRDGGTIQAYLVDAETSEIHAALSDGQRGYDLDVLVENVAFGLADLAAFQGHPEAMDDQIAAAESVRHRYVALWQELHDQVEIQAGDRFAIQTHIRRLNELGFAIGEIELLPGDAGTVRLRTAVAQRDFHARELARRTGLVALEGQARLLLNDLREYRTWLAYFERRPIPAAEGAARWHAEVLEPYLARLRAVIGSGRDPLQAYCDLLEHKWLRSERAQRDLGLEAAFASYVAAGAPAPEVAGSAAVLDLEIVAPESVPDVDLAEGDALPEGSASLRA